MSGADGSLNGHRDRILGLGSIGVQLVRSGPLMPVFSRGSLLLMVRAFIAKPSYLCWQEQDRVH